MALRKVKLYGHLGERFGREFKLDVRTPAEAVRALGCQLKGFLQYLGQPGEYYVFSGKRNLSKDDITDVDAGKTIRIVPAVAGASGGVLTTIAGAVLAIVGVVVGIYTENWEVADPLIEMGIATMLGGVSQMLMGKPKTPNSENGDSYNFGGAVNTTGEGNAIGILYGRRIVGSQVISAGLATQDL